MPTTDRSSPTTTSAVNEKRRPPLTTFATRLISTTRSWSSPYWLSRSRPLFRCSRAIARNPRGYPPRSEAQPALSRPFGQGLDAAVVPVAAAVEDAGLDARLLRPLRQELARALGLLGRAQAAQLRLDPADRRQRAAARVVDQLCED